MQEILLYSVVIPFSLTLVPLMTIARWRLKASENGTDHRLPSSQPTARLSAVAALAFAAAYVVSHVGMHGTPEGQMESWEWLLLLVPLAAVGVTLKPPSWVSYSFAIALALLTGWLVVPSFQPLPWTWRAAVTVSVLCLSSIQTLSTRRLSDGATLLCWIFVGACGMPVLIASANAKFACYSAAVSAAAGGALLSHLFRRHRDASVLSAAVLPVSIAFGTLFFSGYFNDYGDVPFAAFGLLTAAPLALGAGAVTTRNQANSWQSFTVCVLVTVAMCFASVYLAWPALTAEPAY